MDIQQEAEQETNLALLIESSHWIKAHREQMREGDYIAPLEAWAQRAYLAAAESRGQRIKDAEGLLEDIDGAMSLNSVRRGVAMMQDVSQQDWVFETLRKIRDYLGSR